MSAHAHFKIAGIPVRVEPVFLLISALFGLRYIDIGLDVVGIWIAASFISILVHELGHGLTLKVFGEPSAIVLHGFGGVTISAAPRPAVQGSWDRGQPCRIPHRAGRALAPGASRADHDLDRRHSPTR